MPLGALAGVGVAGFGYGVWEATRYTLRTEVVPVLPPGSPRVNLLHFSDVHAMPYQLRRFEWLAALPEVLAERGLAPDMVVSTGDHISSPNSVEPLLAALSELRRLPGAFVFGSNDYFAPSFANPFKYLVHGRSRYEQRQLQYLPWPKLRDELAAGWLNLNHGIGELVVKGVKFAFRGTDDGHLGFDRYELVAGPPVAGAVNIGVTHAPYLRLLDAFVGDGMDLVLAGHTHGGQVCVPGVGALITNCDLDSARAKGLSSHSAAGRTAPLHVSGGLGTSPFAPYRFACRPEVTLLQLVARMA